MLGHDPHALRRRDAVEQERVAEVHPGDVDDERLGDGGREGCDLDLAQLVVEDAAVDDARRLLDALELDRHDGRRLLGEVDAEEVDVRDLATDRVTVSGLDQDGLRLAVEFDIEQGVARDEDDAKIRRCDRDRRGILIETVKDPGDLASTAQATSLARAASLAGLDCERECFVGHTGGAQ